MQYRVWQPPIMLIPKIGLINADPDPAESMSNGGVSQAALRPLLTMQESDSSNVENLANTWPLMTSHQFWRIFLMVRAA